ECLRWRGAPPDQDTSSRNWTPNWNEYERLQPELGGFCSGAAAVRWPLARTQAWHVRGIAGHHQMGADCRAGRHRLSASRALTALLHLRLRSALDVCRHLYGPGAD